MHLKNGSFETRHSCERARIRGARPFSEETIFVYIARKSKALRVPARRDSAASFRRWLLAFVTGDAHRVKETQPRCHRRFTGESTSGASVVEALMLRWVLQIEPTLKWQQSVQVLCFSAAVFNV